MNAPVLAADLKSSTAIPSPLPSNTGPSIRARIVERRTYLRPLDEDGKRFETPTQAKDRVIGHQRWLWENAVKRPLNAEEEAELSELRSLMDQSKISVSGRVKWMGGTDIIKERASAAFNCSFTILETPADFVDAFWLLLQGCGVGFKPKPGLLTGFPSTLLKVEVVPSTRTERGGAEDNSETVEDGVWTIKFGDSAKAWSKAIGKFLAEKHRVHTLRLDYSELRPGGKRLRGYGWLSSGWKPLADGFTKIAQVMMRYADQPLDAVAILDIMNTLGTVLSSRRSAQIGLLEETHRDISAFVGAKAGEWYLTEAQRSQSNNSIMFTSKPSREKIVELLQQIYRTGEPGFVNLEAGRRRAPEMEGFNPCAEILLPSKGFCNLMQVVWHRYNGDFEGLKRAQYLAGRANYRQTVVSMRDGVLQLQWDDQQKLLRLCGVSPTGYVSWEHADSPSHLEIVAEAARRGANDMADDLGLQRARRVTQCQPAGTSSKVLGLEGDEVHEGAHAAMSRYIFNNIQFNKLDPLIDKLRAANYHVFDHPSDPTGVIAAIPVEYPASPVFTKITKMVPFDKIMHRRGENLITEVNDKVPASWSEPGVKVTRDDVPEGAVYKAWREEELEVNVESAIRQLERYRILMNHYIDHNCSITVSFDESEIEEMADWFMEHWDSYIGVSFLQRNDPTKSALELGFQYLPQEAVSRRRFEEYVKTLLPVDLSDDAGEDMVVLEDCATGACPIR